MEWVKPIFANLVVPSESGVYAFVHLDALSEKFIYIGQSENLYTRYCTHLLGHGNSELKKYLDAHPKPEFWYILEDITKLDALEEKMIRKHKPVLNKTHNR